MVVGGQIFPPPIWIALKFNFSSMLLTWLGDKICLNKTKTKKEQVGLSRATLDSQVKVFHPVFHPVFQFDLPGLPSKSILWVNNWHERAAFQSVSVRAECSDQKTFLAKVA